MTLKDIKHGFLSVFRQHFVYHHRSLEFRAKFFAAMICANDNVNDLVYEKIRKIGLEIYGHDEKRIDILIRVTKEYVQKVVYDNGLRLDELIFDLNSIMKDNKKFIKKINLNHLRRLQNKDDEDVFITQQRIIEFAQEKIATLS